MPLPVFIICSEGGSVDRYTNQLSIYDVIEKITLEPMLEARPSESSGTFLEMQPGGRQTAFNSIRMVALWRQAPGDEGQELEFKTSLRIPGEQDEVILGQGRFVYKTTLHRLIATMHTGLPVRSGEIVVTSSVRRPEQEWTTQEYRIPVEVREDNPNQGRLPWDQAANQ